MTQHQYEQRCFSSHVHLLPTSMALSLSSCLSASTPLPQHPTATTPTTSTTTTTITTTPPLCVWQSHSRPCVCWRRYIMPSFHCTPDQREQSGTEKLLLADFFFFFFSFPSFSTITLFYQTSVTGDRTVDRVIIRSSIPLHVENQTEQMEEG